MTNLPEDDARESVNLPGDESAGLGASPAFDAAQEQATAPSPPDANLDANPAATAESMPAFSYIPPSSIPPSSIPPSTVPPPNAEPPLFHSFVQPPIRRLVRIPNFGHLLLLSLLAIVAFSILVIVLALASHFHLLGWQLSAKSATDMGFNLLSEAILYLVTFGFSLFVFPMVWNEGLFAGLQWRGAVALSRFWLLAGTALACFGLAILDQVLMPGPSNAPIEKMISSPGAAWMMFAFGITMAPFFEEMFFRGFLLPALCTLADWSDESLFGRSDQNIGRIARVSLSSVAMIVSCLAALGLPAGIVVAIYWHSWPLAVGSAFFTAAVFWALAAVRPKGAEQFVRPLDANGQPQWSLPAMVIGSIATSIPFALLHVEQQGHSLGPFLLLIVISMILCAVRLFTRSLASSTLVHATYNFFIFVSAMAATGGFRHFDKM